MAPSTLTELSKPTSSGGLPPHLASRGGALMRYGKLPSGHQRTNEPVPIQGRMRADNSIQWYDPNSRGTLPVRHPLAYAPRPVASDPLVVGRAERTLAGRYHQLLLQNRARAVHGPGLVCGPVMNMWGVPMIQPMLVAMPSGGQQPLADPGGLPPEPEVEPAFEERRPEEYADAEGEVDEFAPEILAVTSPRSHQPPPQPAPRGPPRRSGFQSYHPDTPTMLRKFVECFDCYDEHDEEQKRQFCQFGLRNVSLQAPDVLESQT